MIVAPTFQSNTKTASGGRTPQADAHVHVCGVNFNPFDPEYVRVWEQHHGGVVPRGYDVHHLNGDHLDNRAVNLVAIEHGQHIALHNRARPLKTFPLPHGWVVVGGVLVPVSEVDYREQIMVRNGADHREGSDQRVVGRVAGAARKTGKLARAGKITLPAMSLLPLPDDARARARGIYPIVGEIFAARWAVYPGAPIPLTRAFVSQWPGANVSEKTAARGIDDLVAMGILALAGEEPSRCGRPMLLYMPAPVVVAEAVPVAPQLPMSEVIRASLRGYANELEDTSDQHAYWRLKDARYVFEPYVPGLFACRTMSGCAAMIREALSKDAPMIDTVSAPVVVAELEQERRTYSAAEYVAGCAIALTSLRKQLRVIVAEAGDRRTAVQDVEIARLLRRVALIEQRYAEQCLDNGDSYRASPFAQWLANLSLTVSAEAVATVERYARVSTLPHVSYHASAIAA